jgi:hypothetical protein
VGKKKTCSQLIPHAVRDANCKRDLFYFTFFHHLPSFLPSFHYNTWCRRLFFRKSLCLGGRLQLQGEEEEEKKNAAAAKD